MRKQSLVRRAIVFVLLLAMLPALAGYHVRAQLVEQFQEAVSRKAVLTDEQGCTANDFKKPRYSVLDYPTLLATMFVIIAIITAVTHPMELVQKPLEGYRRDIFIPPEV